MTVPTDESQKSDGKVGADKDIPGAGKGSKTDELSPEELQKISGGGPLHADWIEVSKTG